MRQHLEGGFPDISVRGEISNLRIQSSGHAYFTLKDRRAQLNCVMFATERARHRFRLTDGLSVVATGRITVYDRSGSLQLRVLRCALEGQGALWAEFQERAQQLRAEGLTDPARKRALPAHPRRVGIVTSRTGAALRDIVRTLIRRDPTVRIRICHAQVQGRRAAGDIVSAIRCIDRFGGCDVLIVARGGGSIEDLWAFNEMPVVRAIVECTIPVVVGVGHETDLTLADMVADQSASTPTGAAAASVADQRETRRRVDAAVVRLNRAIQQRLFDARARMSRNEAALLRGRPPTHRWAQHIDHLSHRARVAVASRLRQDRQRLSERTQRLASAAPATRLARARAALDRFPARLDAAMQARLTDEKRRHHGLTDRLAPAVAARQQTAETRLAQAVARLDALSPLAVLHRGYALVRRPDGQVVRTAETVEPGESVRIRLAEGTIGARVETIQGDAADDIPSGNDGNG